MRKYGVLFVAASLVASVIATTPSPAAADLDPVGLCDPATPGAIVGTDGDDLLIGTPGPDVIIGLGGNDELRGKDGADILCGGDGDDVLKGGKGADQLLGQGGNDILRGHRGQDALDGGPGDDQLWGHRGADVLFGGPGNDSLRGNKGKDTLDGGPGDDNLHGGPGADLVDGGEGADVVDGGPGNDTCGGETVTTCENDITPEPPVVDDYCIYGIYPDDNDVQILLDPDLWLDPGESSRVMRSVNGGEFVEIAVLDASTLYHLDAPIPSGDLRYVVEALDTAGQLTASHECQGGVAPVAELPTYEDLGIPTLANGVPGASGSGQLPVPVSVPPPPAPSETAGPDTPNVCEAGLVRHLPGPQTWAKVYVPSNTTMIFDIENTKTSHSTGNWEGTFKVYEVNADGTRGAFAGNAGNDLTSYYWPSLSQPKRDYGHFTNNGAGREFFMTFQSGLVISISSVDGAKVFVDNIRYRNAAGEDVGVPCAPVEIAKCADAGGTAYFADDVVVDGVTYSKGCYELDTCVATHGAVLGKAQEWACENDAFLETALIAAGVSAIVLGSIIVIGAAATVAVVQTTGSVLAVETLPPVVLTAAAILLYLQLATYQPLSLTFPDGVSIPVYVPTFDFSGYPSDQVVTLPETIEELADALGVGTGEVVDTLYQQSGVPEPPGLDEVQMLLFRQAVQASLLYCAATILESASTTFLEEIATEFGLGPIVDVKDLVTPDGKHVCTQIPTIMSGSVHHTSGKPIWQATWHMNEVVYGETAYSPEPLHDGAAHPLVENAPMPDPSRVFLHAWRNRPKPDKPFPIWYREEPYSCISAAGNDCDEYPWNATREGGPPTVPGGSLSHLRLINPNHNRASGNELKDFYDACGINNTGPDSGDLFLSVPMLVDIIMVPETNVTHPVPTVFFGNSC